MKYFMKIKDSVTNIYECEINPCDGQEITKTMYDAILRKISVPVAQITEEELLQIL